MARFTTEVALRWSDMDKFGHLNNAVYGTLFEEARVASMFSEAREAGVESFEKGVVVARHETDFLLPVLHEQTVRIELWVERIGNSSFTFAYELFADDKLAAKARTVMVLIDAATASPKRIGEREKEFLERWIEE
ncbi:acyl-CoA thioesterase [Salininema proteolyticum]|uniref:Acyl-CoA thioesterase n=1 Tax=Salininema proteolyticum TaxID=1607685 RepID=A0ABV8U0X9_9ACTN